MLYKYLSILVWNLYQNFEFRFLSKIESDSICRRVIKSFIFYIYFVLVCVQKFSAFFAWKWQVEFGNHFDSFNFFYLSSFSLLTIVLIHIFFIILKKKKKSHKRGRNKYLSVFIGIQKMKFFSHLVNRILTYYVNCNWNNV